MIKVACISPSNTGFHTKKLSRQKNYRVFRKRQSTYPTYTLTIKFEHPVINAVAENHQGTIIFCFKDLRQYRLTCHFTGTTPNKPNKLSQYLLTSNFCLPEIANRKIKMYSLAFLPVLKDFDLKIPPWANNLSAAGS